LLLEKMATRPSSPLNTSPSRASPRSRSALPKIDTEMHLLVTSGFCRSSRKSSGQSFVAMARFIADLQRAELTEKLQLSAHQQKELTPVIEQRDKELEALKEDSSMGKLQNLEKLKEIQTSFHKHAAGVD
jgi:hypothetical protein